MKLIGNDYAGLVDDALVAMPSAERPAYFRRRLWERDSGLCGICGLAVPLKGMHLDHITPRSLGGLFRWENLRPAHRRCNIGRGNGQHRRWRYEPPLPAAGAFTPVSLRMPEELFTALKELAAGEDRSLNAQIVRCLRECVERRGIQEHRTGYRTTDAGE